MIESIYLTKVVLILIFSIFRPQARDVRGKLSDYIHANKSNVVLVENASDGVNAVIRSINFKQNDTVLQLSIAYGTFNQNISLFGQYRASIRITN
jgi:selenocysteine lyase/cysteine desulfurase